MSTTTQFITGDFLDGVIKSTLAILWGMFKTIWPSIKYYVIGFAIYIVGGVLLQIIMLKGSGNRHKLSAHFNKIVGALTYAIFFILYLFIAYKIWGPQVIDDVWFTLIGVLSFISTWLFLRLIGFWYY